MTTPLRVGLIGAGAISHAHVPGWLALGARITVYSQAGSHELAARYGLEVAESLDELWPGVDVIDIVTPTSTHAEFALAAIGRGKHVVCEKPLARTAADSAAVVEAAERTGVRLFPAHVVRYFPEFLAARGAIAAGRIGRPAVFRFRRQSAAPQAAWFFDDAVSGGIVMDQMIHDLDQAEWLGGPVRRVFARLQRRGGAVAPVVAAQVVLDHESGLISHVHGTWGSPALPFSYSFDLAGDTGVLRFDSARDDTVRAVFPPVEPGGYLPETSGAESPYSVEIADFARAIRSGGPARVDGADGVRAVRIAEAALESIERGLPVEVQPTGEVDASTDDTLIGARA
ncbi:Gfo/Idh/MocA family protein [Agromyces italicus]|uniref:Gfo/Idh/MocA family protein n=1 Tax=Agromyces italicus TaxID=279572 RepID=UPI0003FC94C0|nr:Gfo/Idh/MocA family oxidoreductase [Agromyces italicus]